MHQTDLDALARQLATGLTCGCRNPLATRISSLLPELLLEGRPVLVERVAGLTARSPAEVSRALSHLPDLEFDTEGRIVGAGVTLVPTPHRFTVKGRHLFTWCAWDTLSYPVLLRRTAEVESRCAATGRPIRLLVTPEDVRDVQPAGAVVSMVAVAGCASGSGIRSSFCDHVHFFHSDRAGGEWSAEHPEGQLLTIEEAFELGLRAQRALGSADRLPKGASLR